MTLPEVSFTVAGFIIAWFGLEGTLKGHLLVQPAAVGRNVFQQIELLRALSDLTLNTSSDGASTAALGNLCKCLATLIIKKFLCLI